MIFTSNGKIVTPEQYHRAVQYMHYKWLLKSTGLDYVIPFLCLTVLFILLDRFMAPERFKFRIDNDLRLSIRMVVRALKFCFKMLLAIFTVLSLFKLMHFMHHGEEQPRWAGPLILLLIGIGLAVILIKATSRILSRRRRAETGHNPAAGSVQGGRGRVYCPYCKEEVWSDAVKCRHCGERLDMDKQGSSSTARAVSKGAKEKQYSDYWYRYYERCIFWAVSIVWIFMTAGTATFLLSLDPKQWVAETLTTYEYYLIFLLVFSLAFIFLAAVVWYVYLVNKLNDWYYKE